MALGDAVSRYAIGLGCRRGTAAAAIVRLVREVGQGTIADFSSEQEPARPAASLALFTVEAKRHEAGLHGAAAALGLPLVFLDPATLVAAADGVQTRSARVESAVGVPSVAEAAALAGAGPGGRLLGPRVARDGVTCAVAVSREEA